MRLSLRSRCIAQLSSAILVSALAADAAWAAGDVIISEVSLLDPNTIRMFGQFGDSNLHICFGDFVSPLAFQPDPSDPNTIIRATLPLPTGDPNLPPGDYLLSVVRNPADPNSVCPHVLPNEASTFRDDLYW